MVTHVASLEELPCITFVLRNNVVLVFGRVIGIQPQPDPTKVEFSYEPFTDLDINTESPGNPDRGA